ncbi:hypothetical protein LWM68_32265 [Niabella sp. W65]|nr:hypothetical protein [Niabella sp. W65]MCH7367033.1 hypothetical protein [Niabella sp. W65]
MFPDVHGHDWVNITRGGLRFDIAALFYFGGLPLMMMLLPIPESWRNNSRYVSVVKSVFFVCVGAALLLNCIDFIYYRFTLRRTTFGVLKEFQNERNGLQLLKDFLLDFWYVALIFAGLIALMVWLYNRMQARLNVLHSRLRYYITSVAVLLLAVVLAIGGIRGDFKHSTRPITISNAGDYVKSPNEIYLVLNTPFTFIRTMGVKGLKKWSTTRKTPWKLFIHLFITPIPPTSFKKECSLNTARKFWQGGGWLL